MRRQRRQQFASVWKDIGDEKQDTQRYWLELLRTVYGVEKPEHYIQFEKSVAKGFIDGYISDTKVLIEQKDKAFEEISFEDLPREFRRLSFLVSAADRNIKKEMEVSIKAGELVGLIYDELLVQYRDPQDEEALKSLNRLCVRLVFCLYAEDALIFSDKSSRIFHDYIQSHRNDARTALIKLFKILDTEAENRDPYEDKDLLAFPYVNGGLFADENIIIPKLTPEIIDMILSKASDNFDWSGITDAAGDRAPAFHAHGISSSEVL